MTNSLIENNKTSDTGGVGIIAGNSEFSCVGCVIRGNEATGNGGGLYVE